MLFRTEAGRAALLDAFCPHLGAHLGHGGRVEGEGIVCPFHGWQFDPQGRCRAVPYARRVPGRVAARAWPILERDGRIWVWHGVDGVAPFYDAPEIPEGADPDWATLAQREWTIRSCLQELGENGVDRAHFRFVHDMREVPELANRFEGPCLRASIATVFPVAGRPPVPGRIEVTSTGLGCDVMRYHADPTEGIGSLELVEAVCATPIDRDTVHVRMSFRCPEATAQRARATLEGLARWLIEQFERDIPIWEHKRYRERPALCDEDGPISEFRRWCEQFYRSALPSS